MPRTDHQPMSATAASAAGRISPALLAVLVVAGLAIWWLLGDDPEARVREAHADLAELLSTPDEPVDGLPLARIRRLESLFAEQCLVTGDADLFAGSHRPQDLVQQVLAVHGALDRVDVSFGEIRILFPDEDTAIARFPAVLTATEVGGETRTESREVESRMQRIDGDWLFAAFDLTDTAPALAARAALPTGVHFRRTNVIGDDGRELAPLSDSDLTAAVGLIVCDRLVDGRRHFGRGTGTLVGSRSTVLTVAHVLSSNAERSGSSVLFDPVSECRFQQYDDSGELRFEVGFVHAAIGNFRHNSGQPNQDWAVLRTATALPPETLPLPYAELRLAGLDQQSRIPISIVAFHADVRSLWRAPLKSEGRLFAVDYAGFTRLAHTADMGRMSSGAAIVRRSPTGEAVVVGLHRSAANFGEFNLGVPMTAELLATLRGFVYGELPPGGGLLAAVSQSALPPPGPQ